METLVKHTKKCKKCSTDTTTQWYLGPLCKPCYRRVFRQNNLDLFKEKDKKFYLKNKEKIKKRQKEYYDKNIEKCRESSRSYRKRVKPKRSSEYFRSYRLKNKEKIIKYKNIWKEKNKSKVLNYYTNYNKRNPEYRAYMSAKRRATKLMATPIWSDLEKIKKIYANCPENYHVDHIIPLKNPIVCGLHVPCNLQYLPALENIKKNNKLY
jgi:hypothetical protein